MNEILIGPEKLRWPRKGFFRRVIASAAGTCALGGLCGWRREDHWLRIERLPMPVRGLGKDFRGARIAHISDLHCSVLVRQKYLRRCVEAVNALEPDFVAVTGDLLTGPRPFARRAVRLLGELRPKVATLACLGNHDYGVWHPRGLGRRRKLGQYVTELLWMADVFVLTNESRLFRRGESSLQFVGVEDYWSRRYDPDLAFESAHREAPTIALCHNPDGAADMVRRGAQWVLAGHTHGTATATTKSLLMPTESKQYVSGHYRLGKGGNLYVNRGLGYARRVNLNARPEVTLFTLCCA